ncbi:hypothetical protein MATL_G00036090 [Megalops atlanticus]|uniref:TNFR-Cys domain-containing protein n=1 Tax=Megalops atlanticus TaxID=7932 RepID=A0A9D3TGJ8_MEGAT|nr:hypothetical protein MATL_G00036090 [Megalops atlanticus]
MRVGFTIKWIFQGWVTHLIVTLCAQTALSRPTCTPHQYVKDKRCCSKCEPGKYVFAPCTSESDTICRDCGSDEYQPDWNNETKCLPQKYCDSEKRFSKRQQNPLAAVPCQCMPGYQCSLSNCEYCEKIKACSPGQGHVTDKSGRGSCLPCEHGYFSNVSSIEPCKPWTNCKALGKTERLPGNAKADAECGPLIAGISTSWVVVAVLSVIIVISLVILFLFCYKDKLEPFSKNLRACVQNLKRSRIQQETSPAPHSSCHGPQNCTLYEIAYLIRQEDSPQENFDNTCSNDGLIQGDPASDEQDQGEGPAGARSELPSGEPAPPLSSASCSCVLPVNEPLEVGENEDCSQAVASGLTRACSCGSEGGAGGGSPLQETPLCRSCSADIFCSSCASRHGSCDACLESCGHAAKDAASESKGCPSVWTRADRDYRQNEPCCCSIDSTTIPVLSSDSDNDQGLPLQDASTQKFSVGDPSLDPQSECSSHTADPPLTSGHVTGNNNTTFISNGQVMNFSGDVIVVYVSQNSQGSGGTPEEAFGSPVQEESSEDDFQGIAKPKANIVPQEDAPLPLQEQAHLGLAANHRSLPVQEKSSEWSPGKCV